MCLVFVVAALLYQSNPKENIGNMSKHQRCFWWCVIGDVLTLDQVMVRCPQDMTRDTRIEVI